MLNVKSAVAGAITVASLLSTASPALAIEAKPARPSVAITNSCEAHKKLVAIRLDHLRKWGENKQGNYESIVEKLHKLVEFVESKGHDASRLKEHASNLQTRVDALKEEYNQLIGLLEIVQSTACEDPEKFKEALSRAKDQAEKVRELRAEIRKYLESQVRPDVKYILDLIKGTPSPTPTVVSG